MTGALLGLLLGAGLFCLWWSWWPRPQRLRSTRRAAALLRLGDELIQAGWSGFSPIGFLLTCLVVGVAVGFVFLGATRVTPVAVAFGGLAAYGPFALVRVRARARRAVLRELWPDVVDNITSGVRAGLALPEALSQVAVRGPVELRPAFAEFAADYRTSGNFGYCLDRLKDRLSDPVCDRLVESLRIARDVGGSDLGRLLRTLSAFLREDARTRAELETRQSWTVNGARLAVGAPWIVLALMATRPGALDAYGRPAGAMVLLAGAALTVVAYRLMIRIGRLPEEARVLR